MKVTTCLRLQLSISVCVYEAIPPLSHTPQISTWTVLLYCLITVGRGQLKCDGTRAETRFRLSAKWTSPFKSAGGRQFSRLLAAEVCASAVVMLDTPCSEVVWRALATHYIRQFPLHFPSICHRVPSHFNWSLQTITIKRISYHFAPDIRRIYKLPEERLDMTSGRRFILSFFCTMSDISDISHSLTLFLFQVRFMDQYFMV